MKGGCSYAYKYQDPRTGLFYITDDRREAMRAGGYVLGGLRAGGSPRGALQDAFDEQLLPCLELCAVVLPAQREIPRSLKMILNALWMEKYNRSSHRPDTAKTRQVPQQTGLR